MVWMRRPTYLSRLHQFGRPILQGTQLVETKCCVSINQDTKICPWRNFRHNFGIIYFIHFNLFVINMRTSNCQNLKLSIANPRTSSSDICVFEKLDSASPLGALSKINTAMKVQTHKTAILACLSLEIDRRLGSASCYCGTVKSWIINVANSTSCGIVPYYSWIGNFTPIMTLHESHSFCSIVASCVYFWLNF